MTRALRIGTRRSRLAMWQTDRVAALIRESNPRLTVDVVPLETLGDRDKSTALVGLGRAGVFTKEIEEALLENRCDVAVHSYKDVATSLPEGLAIGAVLSREDPRDVLVSRSGLTLEELPPGTVVGTSSLRRKSQLLHLRPDLVIADLRGNVPTRLRAAGASIEEGSPPRGEPIDATVLALAGLKRLELDSHASQILDVDRFLPAPAQGVIAIQIRGDDQFTRAAVAGLNHEPTRRETDAERQFMKTMEGGCHMPLGALATPVGDGDELELDGTILALDGTTAMRSRMRDREPKQLGEDLANKLRGEGALEILRAVASHVARSGGEGNKG